MRAAAGKAGSSQSSLAKAVSSQSSPGLRIFASALVDCNWLRLRRCESRFFFGFIGSYVALLQRHRILELCFMRPKTPVEACKCLRGLATRSERYPLCFSGPPRATPPSPAVSPPAFLACWLLSARDFIARTSAIDSPRGPARSKTGPQVFQVRRQQEQPLLRLAELWQGAGLQREPDSVQKPF